MIDDPGSKAGRIWDPLVRITHWGIATVVLMNALVTDEGGSWHVWLGTIMAALLALRVLWGFIGPENARFRAFPPSLSRAIAHVREMFSGRIEQHPSHNGLGALMVYAIWATLGAVAISGFTMSGFPPTARIERPDAQAASAGSGSGMQDPGLSRDRHGADNGEDDGQRAADMRGETGSQGGKAPAGASGLRAETGAWQEDWADDLHARAVDLLYILIGMHILGVLLETMRAGPQILGRMTGGSDS